MGNKNTDIEKLEILLEQWFSLEFFFVMKH